MPGDNGLGRLVQQPTVQTLPCIRLIDFCDIPEAIALDYPLGNRYLE
ncbi:MAG TPA: hypothetical protein V6D14_23080 [Coleofasciculaceae cyanobacterium]